MSKIALLVGISQNEIDLAPLPLALKDVGAINQVLQNPEIGEFDEVKALLNPDPLSMQEAIESLFGDCQKDDVVLLYFSGFGLKDDEGRFYFSTSKTRKHQNRGFIRASAVSANFVHDCINSSRAKQQLIILDCNFSGAFAQGLDVSGRRGRVLLTSSNSVQYSFSEAESELSIYTRYLIEGLETGSADKDSNGEISVIELHEYAKQKVQEVSPAMQPQIFIAGEEGYKTVIAKAATNNPILRYRIEVERCTHKGEISFVGRSILNTLQKALGLALEDACKVEADVLKPYLEYKEKLKQYEQLFEKAVEKENFLSENTRKELNRFRGMLGLTQESVIPIEERIISQQESRQNPDNQNNTHNYASVVNILHLSDLHFGRADDAERWYTQLASDIRHELGYSKIDVLIVSGDIANKSVEIEYDSANVFFTSLCQEFKIDSQKIVIVPGNHDLNWQLAKQSYRLIDRSEYEGVLQDGFYIEESTDAIRVRDEEKYKQRFLHFSAFYQALKGEPYPLEYEQQGILHHFPEQNLLLLGLNSAWQLDHHYQSRASIHMSALSNALNEIRRDLDKYQNCIKVAVWHHPLDSPWNDRIADQSFLQQLSVAGFRFFLHGHIHKAETSFYRYDMSKDGRKLDRICAGTFGAPTKELNTAYPWQYNLLKFEENHLTVYTRKREEENGAWKADARWGQGAGKPPLDSYNIEI